MNTCIHFAITTPFDCDIYAYMPQQDASRCRLCASQSCPAGSYVSGQGCVHICTYDVGTCRKPLDLDTLQHARHVLKCVKSSLTGNPMYSCMHGCIYVILTETMDVSPFFLSGACNGSKTSFDLKYVASPILSSWWMLFLFQELALAELQ